MLNENERKRRICANFIAGYTKIEKQCFSKYRNVELEGISRNLEHIFFSNEEMQ